MKNKGDEFKEFVLNPNRILKGSKIRILKEECKKGEGLFHVSNPYYATLERDLIISEHYSPLFEMKLAEGDKELELEDIPNPYINFIFKTGKAVFSYKEIQCVNRIRNNIYEVRTELYDFLIETLDFYIEEGSRLKIFEYKSGDNGEEGFVISYNAILNNNIDSSIKENKFNFTMQEDENWSKLTVLNPIINSIEKIQQEKNEYQIRINNTLYFITVI